jgi:hypothetical protein
VKCEPGAVCIGYNHEKKEIATCVCLNGQLTPDDCDKIGKNFSTIGTSLI